MKKSDYFKLAIRNHKFHHKKWIVSVFAMVKDSTPLSELDYLDVMVGPKGYLFKQEDGSLEPIDDATSDKPLFGFLEPIVVDRSWVINAPERPTPTYYGNVLFNSCVLVNAFGNKIDFPFGKVSIKKLENKIAAALISDDSPPKNEKSIFVREHIAFVDSLQFILSISSLCVVTATERNIQLPPGLEEFKKSLILKYGDKLKDPTQYAEFEKELVAFDDKYLEGDESTRGFLAKGSRVKDIARKKLFLTIGAEQGFNESSLTNPILNSLHEGWPSQNPEQFTALMNSLRFGSYSRGNETMRGGVAAKILLRSASNFKILDTDCNTSHGITRIYKKYDIANLVNRYIIENKKLKLIETEQDAETYLGKAVMVRSPMYCKIPGDALCKVCAGLKLAQLPNGLTIPLTEISGIILNTSMKAMHGKVLSTQDLNIEEVFS